MGVQYVLFENAMSVVKLGAMISGLLELNDAHEWVVTTKIGNWVKDKSKSSSEYRAQIEAAKNSPSVSLLMQPTPPVTMSPTKTPPSATPKKIYKRELSMGIFILLTATYGVLVAERYGYS